MTAATATRRSQLHPVFQAALASFSAAPAQIQQIQRDAYVKALQAHDWPFEFSDDHAKYTRGRESLAELRMVQREVDADGALWNSVAPAGHRIGGAA